MGITELLTILIIALLDSINISALVVTFFLLSRPNAAPKILSYVSGIFITYFMLGILLTVSARSLLQIFSQQDLQADWVYWVQGAIGLVLFIASFFVKPNEQHARPKRQSILEGRAGLAGLFVLGVSITFVELTTALPYLGAIGIITASDVPFAQMISVLLGYNLIFIAPPLLLLATYSQLQKRNPEQLARVQTKLTKASRNAWPWALAIIGFLLARDAGFHLFPDFFTGIDAAIDQWQDRN